MSNSTNPITERDIYLWWARRVFQYFLGFVACLLLVLSLARIFKVDLVNWPEVAKFVAYNYGEVLVWLGQKFIAILSSIPIVVFDLITAYLLIGALMRLAIIDIGMGSEKGFYRDRRHWNDQYAREGAEQAKVATKAEAKKFRFFWYRRLNSDLENKFYTLSPIRVLIYLIFVTVLFVLGLIMFGR